MKRTKTEKGITLVALIITIVVLLILASVSISSIKNDGLIAKASQATFISKVKQYEEQLNLYIYEKQLENLLTGFNSNSLSADNKTSPSIKDIIGTMKEKDQDNFIIQNGKLVYIGSSEEEKQWSSEIGITTKTALRKIYGNSIQNGTPSPDNPVEVESVGNRVNLFSKDNWELRKGFLCAGEGYDIIVENKANSASCLYFELKPSTQYTYSINMDAYYINRILEMDENYVCTHNHAFYSWGKFESYSFTTQDTTKYMAIQFKRVDDADITQDDIDNIKFQFEEGSVATEYTPYGKYRIPVKVSGENQEEQTYNIYLNEPLRKVGDVADYIDFSTGKVVRRVVRQLSLKVSEMNHNEPYPGWTNNISILTEDFGAQNINLADVASGVLCNVSSNERVVGINVGIHLGDVLWLEKSIIDMSQTEWITKYPELTVNILYSLATTNEETIELPIIVFDSIDFVEIGTKIQPSKIEY